MDAEVEGLITRIRASKGLNTVAHNKGLTETVALTAELLAVLDERATVNATKNLQLASSVNRLTWAILGFTVVMAVVGGIQTFYTYKGYKLAIEQSHGAKQTEQQTK